MTIKFYNIEDDKFWICCSKEESENIIVPKFNLNNQSTEEFQYIYKQFRESDSFVDMEMKIYGYLPYAYFCISRDMSSCYEEVPHHPFHQLWNAYSPFVECDTIKISNLEELKNLKPTKNGEIIKFDS